MKLSESLREDLIGSDAQTLQRAAQAPDLEKLRAYIAAIRAVKVPGMASESADDVIQILSRDIETACLNAEEETK